MKIKAFTLIELIVGVGVSSLAVLFAATLYLAKVKEAKKDSALTNAASLIRQFLDSQKKSLDLSTDIQLGPFAPAKYLNSKNFSACDPASSPDCQEVYQSLRLTLRNNPTNFPTAVFEANKTLLETFTETLEVECAPRDIQRIPDINLNAIPGRSWDDTKKEFVASAPVIFSQCVPAACAGNTNGIFQTPQLPRIKITRKLPIKISDGDGNVIDVRKQLNATTGANELVLQDVITYFPSKDTTLSSQGLNNTPIAATVCLQVPPGKTQANFRDISFSVFVLTQTGLDRFDMVQQVANLPRPKMETSDSIKILGKVPK